MKYLIAILLTSIGICSNVSIFDYSTGQYKNYTYQSNSTGASIYSYQSNSYYDYNKDTNTIFDYKNNSYKSIDVKPFLGTLD